MQDEALVGAPPAVDVGGSEGAAPLAGLAPLNMPQFKTYLTREIMGMDPNSYTGANIC